ncbi:hypothetical protein FD754_016135 [Muntiacus muntjak]|uniref:Mitotic arrest deficient 1 like 1 n=1 Tax=Muntiacus muntjak TaxID=9888 RepID=A0A5N3VQI5_MUNMU|nr:hypothetical protein FD754_016135 [Muntiacus muntjak]
MEDLGENTTVLSTLRSLNNFISQRVEGGSELDVSTSAQGSLQMQYQQSMQLEERAEQIRSKSHLIQVEREKMQMELSHKRARVELERAASASARSYEREMDRNQELLTRIRQLQEREVEAEEKMKQQLECHRLCQQSLDAAGRRLREKEDSLAEAGETITTLKGRLSDLQWSVMNQEMQVKRLESEKQELKEQLDLQHQKWQEANQKVQELQASQEGLADQEQRIKDLEQKLSLQEQDAAIVKNMRSELVRLPTMERELRQLREENACLRETRDTSGLLREELEGLQRRLGRQEKMQETLVDLELEKELSWKKQFWRQVSILKEISPEYSLKELMLKLKLQYSGAEHSVWLQQLGGSLGTRRAQGWEVVVWDQSLTPGSHLPLGGQAATADPLESELLLLQAEHPPRGLSSGQAVASLRFSLWKKNVSEGLQRLTVLTLYRHPAGLLFFSQFLTVFVRRRRWPPELSGSPRCPWCGWILMGLVPLLMAVRLSPVGLFSPPVSTFYLKRYMCLTELPSERVPDLSVTVEPLRCGSVCTLLCLSLARFQSGGEGTVPASVSAGVMGWRARGMLAPGTQKAGRACWL